MRQNTIFPTWIIAFIYAALLILLAACAPAPGPSILPSREIAAAPTPTVASPAPSAELPAATPSARPTRTPTSSLAQTPTHTQNKPSQTPIASMILIPTGTPFPALVWADTFGEPLILENFVGAWSPTTNELAGLWLRETDELLKVGNMAFYTAPDFTRRFIPPDIWIEGSRYGKDMTWSPDGQYVVFDGPVVEGEIPEVDQYTDLWIAGRSGESSQRLLGPDSTVRLSEFIGWLDGRTLAVADYNGGDSWSIHITDIWKRAEIGSGTAFGAVYQPGPQGVPIVIASRYNHNYLGMIPKEVQPASAEYEEPATLWSPGTVLWEVPEFGNRIFDEWAPGFGQILGVESKDNHADLILWDLKTDTVETIVPDAIDGSFSLDSRWLTAIFEDPVPLTPPDPNQVADNPTYRLSLMHWPDRKIAFTTSAVPLFSSPYNSASFWMVMDGDAGLAFSPDSRYLAYFTLSFSGPDGTSAVLNVLDLQTQSLVLSLPSADDVFPLWAPHSDRLVYLDENHNWRVLDLFTGQTYAFTQQGGDHLQNPAWSFSGSYLSFHFEGRWPDHTAIFEIPAKLP